MKPHGLPRCPSRAFTLIELLVVISIIAVLAALLLPVASKVTQNARKTKARTTELQIVTAVNAFQTEYGVYPLPQDASAGVDTCFGERSPLQSELFDILQANNQGNEAAVNTRGIVYIELPRAKNQASGQSRDGLGANRMLYDPWGKVYFVAVDSDYDGTLRNPYSANAGSIPLRTGVIVYSWGPDLLTTGNFYGGGGDKNVGTSSDDVLSWQ